MNRQYPQGRKDLAAYANALSFAPGDRVQVKVSAHYSGHYVADLVRLYCGDDRPHGTGLDLRPVPGDCQGRHIARCQPLLPGSCAVSSKIEELQKVTISFKIYPTTPERACTILAAPGLRLDLVAGRLQLVQGGQTVLRSERLLRLRRWHDVAVCIDATGQASWDLRCYGLAQSSAESPVCWSERQRVTTAPEQPQRAASAAGCWWIGRSGPEAAATFNGRLQDLRLFADERLLDCSSDALFGPMTAIRVPASLIAAWDFSMDMASQTLPDLTGQHRLRLLQHPTRAVCGRDWDGSVQDWRLAPRHYAAIHFHEDDLTDAGWATDFEWVLPADLDSGVYAVRLQPEPDQAADPAVVRVAEYVPLFVRPAAHAPRAPVALLMSTATYLAYGNQRLAGTEGVVGSKPLRNPNDLYLLDHPEVGLSLYEHHRDGSGVHYASCHRPLLNMRPGSIMWSFNADTNLIAWLAAVGQRCDIITDHELQRQGSAALAPYRVIITGTHPEYYSTKMLDGLTAWLGTGGRLMYMGGNGFYWRIAFDPEDDGVIEVRRAEDGTRAWIAEPGEYYHSFTGEYGGLWRRLGRAPNRLVGVGFTAQGFDGGTYYRWRAAAADPRVAFMVQGLDTRAKLGDFGTQGGGAAGEEIDRFDVHLGSPGHGLVVASSEQHRPGMLLAKEEYAMLEAPKPDARIRADMTFFETPAGGAVFATGSISFAGALANNGYVNPVAQLTGNVLRRFLDPQPFAYPGADSDR